MRHHARARIDPARILGVVLVAATLASGCSDDSGTAASGQTDEPSFVFIQTASQGSFVPVGTSTNQFVLELRGVQPDTFYVSDRPERIVGSAPNGTFLSGFNFDRGNPPNAAIVVSPAGAREQSVVMVELDSPRYDASTATLTYDATLLHDYQGTNLAHLATSAGSSLPQDFSAVSVYLDDCADQTIACYGGYQCTGDGEDETCCRLECGSTGGPTGFCWDWLKFSCEPCNPNAASLCESSNGGPCGASGAPPWCPELGCDVSPDCT